MNNYKISIPIYIGVLLSILFTACESNSPSLTSGIDQDANMNESSRSQTLTLQQRDFSAEGAMSIYQYQLVQEKGKQIQERIQKARLLGLNDDPYESISKGEFYPLHELEAKSKIISSLPSRIQVQNQDGEPDEFIMAITAFSSLSSTSENSPNMDVKHKAQISSPLYTFLSPDRYYPFHRYYSVPDVNFADHYYSFNNTARYQLPTPNSHHFYHDFVNYFPLINMSQVRGVWRLILVEDDKQYRWHSLRRYGNRIYSKLINSLNLDAERVEQFLMHFNVASHRYGSSDDIIPRSGVHNISMSAINGFTNRTKFTRNHVTTSKYMLYSLSSLEE